MFRSDLQRPKTSLIRFSIFFVIILILATDTIATASPLNPSAQSNGAGAVFQDRLSQGGIWTNRAQWTETMEQRFSEWIAHLFRPLPDSKNRGWHVLHDVLRNPDRNSLFNSLGLLEDGDTGAHRIRAVADCGDTPYMLRAYFAWKHGLPFQFRRCTRGNARTGPKCSSYVDNRTAEFDRIEDPVARFNAFIGRSVAWQVHSGTLRTLPNDNGSDFYPIPLTRDAIRPGTVFVDTGGHILVVSQLNDEGLFAIDGHPDKTVTRRRFSPKYFPYAKAVDTGGFKAFRPIRIVNGRIKSKTNRALGARFSVQQYAFNGPSRFFSFMASLIGR